MSDPNAFEAIRLDLDHAEQATVSTDALPHLRSAADRLTGLIDETMARALVAGAATLRSAGASAGLSENAVGPRLARTQTLGAYANPEGRVTATGVERARYDQESGVIPASQPTGPPLRFKPRRGTAR